MRFGTRSQLWQMAVDAGLIAGAWYLAYWLRFDHGIPSPYSRLFEQTIYIVVPLKLAVFILFGLYSHWWRYVSIRDMWSVLRGVVVACLIAALAIYLINPVPGFRVPRGVFALDLLLLLGFVAGVRLLARTILERPGPRALVARGKEALIVGAGDAGQLIVREMLRSPALGYTPIGIVDDDSRKRRLRLHGIKVVGTTAELPEIIADLRPAEVIIAIPSAAGETRANIVAACRDAGVPVKTLPSVYELIADDLQLARQLREVQVEDVLGREAVELDVESVASYLAGQTVLVTGAGGSIGAELCRQIAAVGPERLVLIEHSETALVEIARELVQERRFSAVARVLADVKNQTKMRQVFERYRPSVVFHAAAYKHVPLMEANPIEAVRNNVIATKVMAEVAAEFEARAFVLVSTDKAVNPTNVLGQTKLVCEWIVHSSALDEGNHDEVPGRALRQRARVIRQRDPALPAPDCTRRPRHGYPPRDDPVLHDDPGGCAADRPGRCDRRVGRRLRARHGRAGEDPRPRAQHDSPLRQGAGPGHRGRVHRPPPGREAARGVVGRRRGGLADLAPEDPARVGGERRSGLARGRARRVGPPRRER